MSYDPLLSVLGLAALASASTPTTFAPTAARSGVAVQAAALPSNPITGDLAVDSGDGNTLKWYDGTTWQVAGGGSGSPAGIDQQVQYNDSGNFGASAEFFYDAVEAALTTNNLRTNYITTVDEVASIQVGDRELYNTSEVVNFEWGFDAPAASYGINLYSSAPSETTGVVIVDSVDNMLKWYDGSSWQVAGGSSAVTSVNSQTGDVVIGLGDLTAPGSQGNMFYHDSGIIAAADRVLFSGDSNYGGITLDTFNDISGGSPTLHLSGFSDASTDFAGRIQFTNNGSQRWEIWPSNPETGGDAGCDFYLLAHGTFGSDEVIAIQRNPAGSVSGAITFSRPLVTYMSQPSSPIAGMTYVDSTSNTLRWYNGSGWVNAGGATPAGSTTQIQYNDGGSFAGSALLTFETGVVTIGSNATNSQVGLDLNTAAANNRAIRWRSAGVTRWQLFVNPDTESGSDEGAGILLSAFNDAGSPIDNPISIVRKAGGLITLSRTVFVNGDVELEATKAFYLGDADTNGSWRFTRSGDDLLAQRREAGVYVTKQTISA